MARGEDTSRDPRRQAQTYRRIPNEEQPPAYTGPEPEWEPDYESIMERRAERHRPDWA